MDPVEALNELREMAAARVRKLEDANARSWKIINTPSFGYVATEGE